MRYWVYINDKVDGPYDENKLVTLNGFSQNTLICSEEVASNGGQEWVKASSIFEFDEVPVQEEVAAPAPQPIATTVTPTPTTNVVAESLLLEKLNSLTEELSHLHKKLDSMQTNLDKAIAQNEHLSQQIASQASNQTSPIMMQDHETRENTITLLPSKQEMPTERKDDSVAEQNGNVSFPDQAEPKEEELIIRSALDSIYGEKPIPQQPKEDETFQDLLPKKETEKVGKIEEELTFTPVEESTSSDNESIVKEALITTPSAEEISRDELINELTASPKEDILDQIIEERKGQEPLSADVKKGDKSSLAGAAVAGAAAVAGLAGIAAASKKDEAISTPDTAFSMATDKNNPEQLEPVLPADQMPEDVAVKHNEEKATPQPSLTSLPTMDDPQQAGLGEQPAEFADIHEDTIQELVPGATLEKEHKEEVDNGIYEKPYNEVPANTQPIQGNDSNILTEKDLEDAFGPHEESLSQTTTETPENKNPNDLTEIELKEGSTYLISDFVPPAQVGDDAAALNAVGSAFTQSINKQQETIIQDMLAVSNKAEKTQTLPTEGLPANTEASRISLENTIQAKRGAAFDIKTAPMVPEPADSPRLDVSDLDDVNAQHDIKKSSTGAKLAKLVAGALAGLLLLIVIYAVLGIMNLLPPSLNLFSNKQATPASSITQEILQDRPEQDYQDYQEDSSYEEEALDDQVLSSVQNFALPNDMTLKQLVQSKHPTISEELISWEVADAIEPDNYAITIKVPPENPQNFKTVYRFNYNADNGLLEPTISDAKNLLDQVYGTQA